MMNKNGDYKGQSNQNCKEFANSFVSFPTTLNDIRNTLETNSAFVSDQKFLDDLLSSINCGSGGGNGSHAIAFLPATKDDNLGNGNQLPVGADTEKHSATSLNKDLPESSLAIIVEPSSEFQPGFKVSTNLESNNYNLNSTANPVQLKSGIKSDNNSKQCRSTQVGQLPDFGLSKNKIFQTSSDNLRQMERDLHVSVLEKQHMQAELIDCRALQHKLQQENFVLNGLNQRREKQLKEADSQLLELQASWTKIQDDSAQKLDTVISERDSMAQQLKRVQRELDDCKIAVSNYHVTVENLQECQAQLNVSQAKFSSCVEENRRLNNLVQRLETALLNVTNERDSLQNDVATLYGKVSSLELTVKSKMHLEKDLQLLQEQRLSLLEKIVVLEEGKQMAGDQIDFLKREIVKLTSQMELFKTRLHQHYQGQVEDVVAGKSQAMQDQLSLMESRLKESFLLQLDEQRNAHQESLGMMSRKLEEQARVKIASKQKIIDKMTIELSQLRTENGSLQGQREVFITAVSSIMVPPTHGINVANSGRSEFTSRYPSSAHMELSEPGADVLSGAGSYSGNRDHIASERGTRSGMSNLSLNLPKQSEYITASSDSDASIFRDGSLTVRERALLTVRGSDKRNWPHKNGTKRVQQNIGEIDSGRIMKASEILMESFLTEDHISMQNCSKVGDSSIQNETDINHLIRRLEEMTNEKRADDFPTRESPGLLKGKHAKLPERGQYRLRCQQEGCQAGELVPFSCNECQRNFCLAHRHQVDHACPALKPVVNTMAEASAKIRHLADKMESSIKGHGKKSDHMTAKVQLMKLKQTALGDSSLPAEERIYLKVMLPKGHKTTAQAVFVSYYWSIGKAVDFISDLTEVANQNNFATSEKLVLFNASDGRRLGPMDTLLKNLVSNQTLFNGQSVILEYVSSAAQDFVDYMQYN